MTDSEYIALIGDIRGSRELADREEVQREFKRVVDFLNEALAGGSIASRFTVTTGDEFQVLLTDASDAVEAAVLASDRFDRARLRFGLGRGGLETSVNPDQAIGMDGPCFHRAREAIKSAETDGAWVRVEGWSPDLDRRFNAMFDLVQSIREDWTDRQAEFALALAEEGTQTRVADCFDVSKSTVSESLSAGHVHEVRNAERELAEWVQDSFANGANR